jgi:hypothetical protein
LQAKGQCQHGEWLPWLKANVRFSEPTAQAYMRIADRWDELQERRQAKTQHVADLTFRGAIEVLAEAATIPLAEAKSRRSPPIPALRSGQSYFCVGGLAICRSAAGQQVLTLARAARSERGRDDCYAAESRSAPSPGCL